MTDQVDNSQKSFVLNRNEFEGTGEAIKFYMHAFTAYPDRGDAYGRGAIARFLKSPAGRNGYMWVDRWYGRNHQRIAVGDTVRLWSPNDDPEYSEAEVLAVSTFAAFVLWENGAEWVPWPLVHRRDRLHTEPEFDATHWVPVAQHMGYDVTPQDAAEYESACKRLTLVRDGKSGGAS